MKYFCCLCEAEKGELREGHRNPAGGVPLCATHHASIYWQSRQPKPPRVIVFGSPEHIEAEYVARSFFGGQSLADLARPAGDRVQ